MELRRGRGEVVEDNGSRWEIGRGAMSNVYS